MRPVTRVLAGITLVVTLMAALFALTSPTSATSAKSEQLPPVTVPSLPADLPVQVPGGVVPEGVVPELPVDVPALPGLEGVLACITGSADDGPSPAALTGALECIIKQVLELLTSLLGGVGGGLPVGAPAL